MNGRLGFVLAVAVVLAALLAGCAGATVAPAAPASTTPESASATEAAAGAAADLSKFLVYGYSGEPASLDAANSNGVNITAQIEESLVSFKPGTLELAPGLAESWSPQGDSKVELRD